MAHLKRLVMPREWPLSKKAEKFVVSPIPGPHPKMRCIPLQVIIRDILGYAESAREARKILNEGKVLVDGKVRKEAKFPVGLMDVIEIPEIKEYYRVVLGKSGLFLQKIPKSETSLKLCRIQGKKTLKKGIQQLNLHDGRNINVDKDVYRVGDSILIHLPDQKILKHFKLQPGSPAVVISGRNTGVSGKIKDIRERKSMLEKSTVKIDAKDKVIETLKEYVMVGEIKVKA